MAVIVVGGTVPSCVYCTQNVSSATASSFSFAGQSIGAAPSNGKRIVVVSGILGGVISGVTIAGVTATAVSTVNPYMYYAAVPTGATGTIVVTSTGASTICTIMVEAIYDLASNVPRAVSALSVASPAVVSVTVPPRGVAVAVATSGTNGSYTWNFGGSTVAADYTNTVSINNFVRSIAHVVTPTGGSPLSITCTYSSSSSPRAIAASWR